MQITFLGATKTVTGSNFLVEGAGKKFLIDCGLYQGGSKEEEKNYIFAKIGTILSGLLVIWWIVTILIGIRG